jgi:adenylate kinase family enzyme
MGEILRRTVLKAKEEEQFKRKLGLEYGISEDVSIFDEKLNRLEIVNKSKGYIEELSQFLNKKDKLVSQFDWLEFCVMKGLLVPDEWTVKIMDAIFENLPELQKGIFILDGYPRTITAAEFLLNTFDRLNIPVIKVLHLSITKEQMKIRAFNRMRKDDTEESLERRYQFYIDKVQPCIDYLKRNIGSKKVALIDAHQPVFDDLGNIDVNASIHEVTLSVIQALGLPGFLLDLK